MTDENDRRPAPPIPRDVDLRGMPFMPVDTSRLLDSDTFALSSGDQFKAAFTLWCKAWQQVPAGSLPRDERILASWVGPGIWRKVRDVALRGFVECTDGRLYHELIVEKAIEAWEFRRKQSGRAAKRWSRGRPDPDLPGIPPGRPDGDPDRPPVGPNDDPAADPTVHAAADPAAMQGTGTGTGTLSSNKGSRERNGTGRGIIGSTMTSDWQLPDRWRDWAIEALGWTAQDTLRFSVYFRDKHLERGTVSKEWFATWRVWCNKEAQFQAERLKGVRRA